MADLEVHFPTDQSVGVIHPYEDHHRCSDPQCGLDLLRIHQKRTIAGGDENLCGCPGRSWPRSPRAASMPLSSVHWRSGTCSARTSGRALAIHIFRAPVDEDNIVALQRCSRIGDNAGRCQREPGVGVASVELTRQKLTDPLATRRGWVIASHRCRQRIKAAAILVRGYGFGATQRRGWSTLSGPGRRRSSRPRRGRQPRADTTADLGVKPSLESRGF